MKEERHAECEICGKPTKILTARGGPDPEDMFVMALCKRCYIKVLNKMHPDVVQTIHNEYLKRHANGSV